jgi:ATP-binding cassette subfamily B protein
MMGTAIGLLNILPSLAKGIESIHSIEELLGSEDLEQNEGKARLEKISGAVSIRNLSVEFGNRVVLDSLNLEIPAKTTYAFVGPSGSGKTTLLHTILGMTHPSQGNVFYEEQAMTQLDMRSIRRHIAYVPQESVVLDGSVRDNVALGLPEDDEKISEALTKANLSELVTSERGINQVIGRSGTRLSVGQRQRLAIARALYREPKILVLDEATSALDMESERFIQKTLADLAHNVTIIVVAHRLATVQGADQICYLDSGRIVETGTHDQLMRRGGSYYKMVMGKEMD